MIDFFIKIHLTIPSLPVIRRLCFLQRCVRGGVRICANIALPLWFFLSRRFYGVGVDDSSDFVVSLTSFPARIKKVSLCVESLLRQKKKPRMVMLWLSKEQFNSKEELPIALRKQEFRGLKIFLREGDIRSHKKYFYAMTEYPDLNVITVDDDVFYASTLTEDLFGLATAYPQDVIGNQVKKISVRDGQICLYHQWESLRSPEGETVNVPIGVGGVYYPMRCLRAEAFTQSAFMTAAPCADDLWLGSFAYLSGIRVRASGKKELEQIPIIIFSNETLFSSNGLGQNDAQLKKIFHWVTRTCNVDLEKEIISKNAK